MYHSITIGDKNTWADWHLIPKTRPHVSPPVPKTKFVEIPGGNGSLDLSTALTGMPVYADRTGTWDFYVENDFRPWHELYSEIMNAVHGFRLPVVLEDDPLFYYEGRIAVASWQTENYRSVISFNYTLAPFKRLVNGSMTEWIWDAFNFAEGIVRDYSNIDVDGTKTVTVLGKPIECNAVITASAAGMTVEKGGVSVVLSQGENYITEFTIQNGANELTFTGTGTVSVDFDGESL